MSSPLTNLTNVASETEAAEQSAVTLISELVPVTIAVINESTSITDAQVLPVLAALRIQLTRDFAPIWGRVAKLVFFSHGATIPASYWQMALLDDSDQAGALGYHETTASGQPLGKCFVKSTIADGLNWTVTLSHELLEMLVDPYCNVSAEVDSANGVPSTFYAYECCDAPEDDPWGYAISGVTVSDFVYPAWFIPGAPGPYDHQGHITAPLQLLSGGYIGVLDVTTENGWQQLQAEQSPATKNTRSDTRLEMRRKPRSQWIRSAK